MSSLLFYREQAARQGQAADEAILDNVRERCRRAAAAWSLLAARVERADEERAATAERKQQERHELTGPQELERSDASSSQR